MKRMLVIGGSGTLGEAFIKRAVLDNIQVTCFSRDELKHKELEKRVNSKHLKCVMGDVRDFDAVQEEVAKHDTILHFAAIKHVDTAENNPEEVIKTNVNGTMNIVRAMRSLSHNGTLIFSSTDKAVDPINVYGFSKALSEGVIRKFHADGGKAKIYRWGNVIGSRGSALPFFIKSIVGRTPVEVTHQDMTRFWIKIEDAVGFIYDTMFIESNESVVFIPKIKAASIIRTIGAIAEILGVDKHETKIIGIRPGEKIHERLVSIHDEPSFSSDNDAYTFKYDELLNYLRPAVLGLVE